MNIYLATGNTHKLLEFVGLLCDKALPLNLFSAEILGGMPEVDESGKLFIDNARIKACAIKDKIPLGSWVLADDSGLEVDVLNGEPGVFSARYAGENATDRENVDKLIAALKAKGLTSSTARFTCALYLTQMNGKSECFIESCEGRVITEVKGEGGFGYDPIFIPDGYEETFGMLGVEIKHQLSHRAKAAQKLKAFLSSEYSGLN